ncbi:MAG: hypothetical protein ACFFBP_10220 [Promethearchaeota archaeon]
MYIFDDHDEIELIFKCKTCFKEEKLIISKLDYIEIKSFPFTKEFIHENPPHKLILSIDKNLEVENFQIEDILEKDVDYSKEVVTQALSEIDLTDDEIKLYFLSSGRNIVSLGEMAILINKSKEECEKIAKKFVEKGLFKPVIGPTPHFSPLPPYAALVSQLTNFHEFISEIHTSAPKQLGESFTELETKTEGVKNLHEYTDFMKKLKDETLGIMDKQRQEFEKTIKGIDKVREVGTIISNIEKDTQEILKKQNETITEQFDTINTKVAESIKSQLLGLIEEMMSVKTKISSNLQKLRLGVIQQTVDQVIDNVFSIWIKEMSESLDKQITDVQSITEKALKNSIEEFFNDFTSNMSETIGESVNNLNTLLSTSSKTGEEIKTLFSDIDENFSRAVNLSEEKLEGVTDSIFNAFGHLKDTFTNQIISTLDKVLGDIIKKLEISQITTKEFWEQSKKSSTSTMKDIWFIRSVEGVKAHIDEEMKKLKARMLIIAPEITDVNIEAVKACKKHINIRIAASIDLSRADHVAIHDEIENMQNVSFRYRELQNIWGMNRDYESVILCVISKSIVGGELITEIAGIGSMVDEHIKIFVSSLEDAWLNARKEMPLTMKPSIAREIARKKASIQSSKSTNNLPAPAPAKAPVPAPAPAPSPSRKISSKPTLTSTSIPEKKIIADTKAVPAAAPAPALASTPMPNADIIQSSSIASEMKDSNLTGDAYLTHFFDTIMKNLDKSTGLEIVKSLTNLYNDITEIRGYTSILKQIDVGIKSIKNQDILKKSEVNSIKKKIEFWKKKLNL